MGYIASLPFVFAASLAIVAVGLAVLALMARDRMAPGSMPVAAPAVAGIAGCLPGLLGLEPAPWFAVVAGFVYAASIAVLNFSWYELLAREGAVEGTLTLAVAVLGSSLLASALRGLSPSVLYGLDMAFIAVGAVIVRVVRREAGAVSASFGAGGGAGDQRGSARAAVRAFLPPLATLAVLEMTVGTLNATSLNGYSLVMGSVPLWVSTGTGAGLFLAILLVARAPKSSEFIYLRLFPVLMAVLGGCVVVGEPLSTMTGVTMLVAYNLFTFSVAYTLFALCNERGVSAYLLAAVNLVVIKVALIAGLAIGLIIMEVFGGQVSLTTAVVFAIYMLAMVAVVVQRFSPGPRRGAARQTQPDPVEAGRSIAAFGDAHGLTPREREVFLLVVRGWGAKQIADELTVSENTVWSHVKHIYAKLGVQSKQEAINLWEGQKGTGFDGSRS